MESRSAAAAREARLDAAPEGLSVTNDHGAMHTQTDRGHADVEERERERGDRKTSIRYSRIRFFEKTTKRK